MQMASLSRTRSKAKNKSRQKDGWTIQFYRLDDAGRRRRHSIRLGAVPNSVAREVRTKVAALVAAKMARISWDVETASWVGGIEPDLYDKLAAVGLVPPRPEAVAVVRKPHETLLGPFVAAYIARPRKVKPGTVTTYKQVERNLTEYFGADKPLRDITPAEADDFRGWLAADRGEGDDAVKGLGGNTVNRRCGIAKQFFRYAVRAKYLAENPFGDMKGLAVRAERSRDYHLSREDAAKLLATGDDAPCPDAQWRLLIALSRFGGLRCPSEHLELRWGDVNWAAGRMTVRSPKTEHHGDANASRVIPIFAELRPYLQAVWDEVTSAEDFDPQTTRLSELPVITRYRHANANLRTQFERIIKRAGLKPWPKLFHNLRATRQTELAASHPIHVVCEWIGNKQAVAMEHYLRPRDEDWAKATGDFGAAKSGAPPNAPGTPRGDSDTSNPRNVPSGDAQGAGYCTNDWLARTRT